MFIERGGGSIAELGKSKASQLGKLAASKLPTSLRLLDLIAQR